MRDTQHSLFKIYDMAMCINLESLDLEILQVKILLKRFSLPRVAELMIHKEKSIRLSSP